LLTSLTAPNGGAVLAPKHDALYPFMQEAAQPPVSSRATQRAYRVEVWNGSGHSNLTEVAAERLRLEGFEVVGTQETEVAARTTIVDYTTTSKGSPLPTLLQLYRRQQRDVKAEPQAGSATDFRVILGRDYNPCDGTGTVIWRAAATPKPTPTPAPETPIPEATPAQ